MSNCDERIFDEKGILIPSSTINVKRVSLGYIENKTSDYYFVTEDSGKLKINYAEITRYMRDDYFVGRSNVIDGRHRGAIQRIYVYSDSQGVYIPFDTEDIVSMCIHLIHKQYKDCLIPANFDSMIRMNVIPSLPLIEDIVITPEFEKMRTLYTDGEVIAFKNGYYSLRYDMLLPPTPCIFKTSALQVNYNPINMNHPIEKYYREMFDDDDTYKYFFELVGYTLYASTFFIPTYFVMYGESGSNGKSAAVNAIMRIVGKNNYSQVTLEGMANDHVAASMEDKAMNILSDSSTGAHESAFKSVSAVPSCMKTSSSGESIEINPKYKQPHIGFLSPKFVFASNVFLNLGDTTGGAQRRLQAVPFNKTFKENRTIAELFKEESAIEWFALEALNGFRRFINNAMHGKEYEPGMKLTGEYSECVCAYQTKTDMMVFSNIIDDYLYNVLELDIMDKQQVHDSLLNRERFETDFEAYKELKAYADEIGRPCSSQTRFTQYMKKFGLKYTRVHTSSFGKSDYMYVFKDI